MSAPPLRDFCKEGWKIVDPGRDIHWRWHLDAVCEHLEALSNGEIQDLVINIPPGHAKSVIVSVLWPAWQWVRYPEWRALFSSYDLTLVTRDAARCREVIESEWYQKEFSPSWRFASDQNAKTFYKNTKQGFRFCHSVAGKGTGHRGDTIVVDDPLNARHRHSVKKREAMLDWWRRTMPTRLNDPATGQKVIIMQRLHVEDLTAEVLRQGGWVHLNLMSRFDPDRKCVTYKKDKRTGEQVKLFEDPRKERDDVLFEKVFPKEELDKLERQLGEEDFAAQHQQLPAPAEGGIFKKHFWGYWQLPGDKLPPVKVQLKDGSFEEIEAVIIDPETLERQIQSWDLTFKAKKTSDFVVGQVWGTEGINEYLLDQVRDRMGFTQSKAAILALSELWPRATTKFIEDKANGSAILDDMHSEIQGLVPVEPRGDKEERAWPLEGPVRSRHVFLPHPMMKGYDWVIDLRERFAQFPNGPDDEIDAAGQAHDQLRFQKKEEPDDAPAYNPADAMEAVEEHGREDAPPRPTGRRKAFVP